ncbi:hypothetical protein [Mycobacteroides abscessus]|uniref:hypothetical protein n=1 Tax=Mycobacteroides abscessus TaxID=36809 RepID=UPI0012FFDBD8|nr:hypothetical protein [Mycobacteroides abscessus]
MTLDKLDELMPDIKKAARSVAFQWPGIVDRDDVEQSISLHLLERPGSIKKILGMEGRARYRAIVGIGHQIASQERTDYDYYKGAFNYSVDDVKGALKDRILTVPVFEKGQIEIGCDLFDALGELKVEYVESIYTRYAEDTVPTPGAAQKRLSDALARLTDEMNRAAKRKFANRVDGPGTRKPANSNAAHYQSKKSYDAEYVPLPEHMRNSQTCPEVWE